MIGIVDYGAGNVSSVERALKSIGVSSVMTQDVSVLERCTRLIVPGVGEASYAMERLRETGLDDFLREWEKSRPIMGICLGSQIVFDHSDEGDTKCLGLVRGTVRHFYDVWRKAQCLPCKVPHIGWNDLEISNGGTRLLQSASLTADYYFVHSYVMCPEDESIVKAYTDYGCRVPAVVEWGNVSAFQFHPEKSGRAGLSILREFSKGDASC